jgi:hypothetical protein
MNRPILTLVPTTPPMVQQQTVARGGEPPHHDGMEARVAKLEATVEHIQRDIADIKIDMRDIRKLIHSNFIWMLGGFATMLAVMAHGFHWL